MVVYGTSVVEALATVVEVAVIVEVAVVVRVFVVKMDVRDELKAVEVAFAIVVLLSCGPPVAVDVRLAEGDAVSSVVVFEDADGVAVTRTVMVVTLSSVDVLLTDVVEPRVEFAVVVLFPKIVTVE